MDTIKNSAKISARIQEIKNAAAELPEGGNLEKLQQGLCRLSSWTTRTMQYVSRLEQEQQQDKRSGTLPRWGKAGKS